MKKRHLLTSLIFTFTLLLTTTSHAQYLDILNNIKSNKQQPTSIYSTLDKFFLKSVVCKIGFAGIGCEAASVVGVKPSLKSDSPATTSSSTTTDSQDIYSPENQNIQVAPRLVPATSSSYRPSLEELLRDTLAKRVATSSSTTAGASTDSHNDVPQQQPTYPAPAYNPYTNQGYQSSYGQSQLQSPASPGLVNSVDPDRSVENITGPSTSNTVSCTGGGGLLTDANFRSVVKAAGIDIKPNSASYEKMPSKVSFILKRIKDECSCNVMLTAGTETKGHVSHGPGKAIFDLRQQEPMNSYIRRRGKSFEGVVFTYEGAGANSNTTAAHWHVNANGYACSASK